MTLTDKLNCYQCGGVLVRASVLRSVDLGSVPLLSGIEYLKNGNHPFSFGTQHERHYLEK